MALVREIMTHPRVYRWITDDSSPQPWAFQPVEHDGFWYVMVYNDDGVNLGLFLFHPSSDATWEVHTCLLPVAWGMAAQAARECAEWMWQEVPQLARIVTRVPANNRLALMLAREAGMTQWGVNPQAWRKGGVLWDEYWLGMSRPR